VGRMESGSRRRRRRRCKIKMHWPTHILFGVCFHVHASARIHCVTCVWWQMTRPGRRSWCSRLRSCARLWIWTFLQRASRIRENASCKK
jgi:hypothetical protein